MGTAAKRAGDVLGAVRQVNWQPIEALPLLTDHDYSGDNIKNNLLHQADALGATADFPDMLDAVGRARTKDLAGRPVQIVGPMPGAKDATGIAGLIDYVEDRDGKVIWQKPFLTGQANMSHTIANLEHHQFKNAVFRRPGDVHVHFFGTATLS